MTKQKVRMAFRGTSKPEGYVALGETHTMESEIPPVYPSIYETPRKYSDRPIEKVPAGVERFRERVERARELHNGSSNYDSLRERARL